MHGFAARIVKSPLGCMDAAPRQERNDEPRTVGAIPSFEYDLSGSRAQKTQEGKKEIGIVPVVRLILQG